MGIIINRRKEILKKILNKYDNEQKKNLLEKKKGVFECEILEKYKEMKIKKK